ncbi:glutamic acid-rich protein-like [Helianthus annuus]|uniref:glutamic acid-rich protein-like n=1 Tax=Helianthus annuus TaxID=4232 RepID=UPI000B90A03D|nr:glutamic acid-rich protein-like [Helianthus annuus]
MPESQSGKSEKHVTTSKGSEVMKEQHVEVPKEPEVQSVEKREDEVQMNVNDDDYVEVRDATPSPPPTDQAIPEIGESSQQKKTTLPDLFEGFPNIRGELKDDFILGDEFDMFHDGSVKALEKKVSILEKEKAKAEADRDELKKQLEELIIENAEIKKVMIKQAKKLKKMEDDVSDNAQLFELLSADFAEMEVKNKKLNDITKTLNQMINELHEASANEFNTMKLEMGAMKADKAVKDEQLNMLYTVMESHLGINVQDIYNNLEIQRVEERRIERERRLDEEATQRKKIVIVETQEAGGSSSQADVEMVDAEEDPKGFVLVGESSLSFSYDDIISRVVVEQRRRKAKEPQMLLLKWKEDEIVKEDEEEEVKLDDDLFDIDNYQEGNEDDDDQG